MEKGKISSLQMAMMMFPAIAATAVLGVPSITAKYAKNDLWLSPILASLIGFVTVYIAYQLHKLYPKETVIQFSERIIGRFAGKILGILFLFFYIQTGGLIIRQYAEFIVDSFLVNTPISVIMASMVFLCALIVHGGLEELGRAAQLFFPVLALAPFFFIIFLGIDFEFRNIFPILGDGMMPPIKGAVVPGGWFTEFFLITFLLPFLEDQKKGRKYGMMAVLAVMMLLVMINLIVLFVLGPTTPSKIYPLFTVIRYISIAEFFEHLESGLMALWIVGAFVKMSVFYYATVLGTSQWLNLSDYRPVVWSVGILILEFSFWSLPNTIGLERYLVGTFPPFALLIQTIIPLFLLVIAVVRKRKKESKTS